MTRLRMQVGDIWQHDTTPIYVHNGLIEHWLIVEAGLARECWPEYGYSAYDHYVRYVHLESGRASEKLFYGRDYNTGGYDLSGNPYWKRVA